MCDSFISDLIHNNNRTMADGITGDRVGSLFGMNGKAFGRDFYPSAFISAVGSKQSLISIVSQKDHISLLHFISLIFIH